MAQQSPILVPISDAASGFEALRLAGLLARVRKVPVHVVHVIEVALSLPLNAAMESEARRGEHLLRRAEDVARREEFPIKTELLQSRQAGEAIVEESHALRADAIVLGIPLRHSPGESDLGATTTYVLRHARCRVIVVREAAPD